MLFFLHLYHDWKVLGSDCAIKKSFCILDILRSNERTCVSLKRKYSEPIWPEVFQGAVKCILPPETITRVRNGHFLHWTSSLLRYYVNSVPKSNNGGRNAFARATNQPTQQRSSILATVSQVELFAFNFGCQQQPMLRETQPVPRKHKSNSKWMTW